MSQALFRKTALERLSSPEKLDELMRVTHPRAWISLTALGAVVLAALIWGFGGHIPTQVAGLGMIIRPGGVYNVVSQGGGVVTEIDAKPGDVVTSGEMVARIAQPLTLQQLRIAQESVDEAQRELNDEIAAQDGSVRMQMKSLTQQIAIVNEQMANSKTAITELTDAVASSRESLETMQKLESKGLVNRQIVANAKGDLLTKQQQLAAAQERLTSLYNDLQRIDIQRQTVLGQRDESIRADQEKLRLARAKLEEVHEQLQITSRVVSPYDGAVIDLLADPGMVVQPASPVLNLEIDFSKTIKGWEAVNEAVVFVPSADAKRVQPGMDAKISPADVKQEEYGYMIGRVERVSKFAASPEAMMRLLSNESLVRNLSAAGPVNEVLVSLVRTNDNPSGYEWSSSKTPNFHIHSGTPCAGSFIVARNRPIEMVIPYVREKLGI